MFPQLAATAAQHSTPASAVPAVLLRICPRGCHPSPKGGSNGTLPFGRHVLQEPEPLGSGEDEGGEL